MRIQQKFFKINAAIFLFLGAIVYVSLHETTPIQAIQSEIIGTRGPASVSSELSLKSTETLKIDCDDLTDKEVSVKALQVRLEGLVCTAKDIAKVTINNETTGKEATYFKRGKIHYTTDFIQLKRGKNQISFITVLKNSTEVKRELTLIQ